MGRKTSTLFYSTGTRQTNTSSYAVQGLDAGLFEHELLIRRLPLMHSRMVHLVDARKDCQAPERWWEVRFDKFCRGTLGDPTVYTFNSPVLFWSGTNHA